MRKSVHAVSVKRGLVRAGSCAMLATMSLCSGIATAAETKAFVVSWFLQAAYSYDGDCPDGVNPPVEQIQRIHLKAAGVAPNTIEQLMKGIKGGLSDPGVMNAVIYRGRIDGQPAHAYTYPTSVPEVRLNEVKGKYALGFDLDGKAADEPGSYEDPETHVKGIDNRYWRAMGCNKNHRGTPKVPPTEWQLHWDNLRDKIPAWVITITADDFTQEGSDVTVGIYNALERISRDANGNVRAKSTFRINPDTRFQNELKGKIQDGRITVSSDHLSLLGDPYFITQLKLTPARLRLTLNEDGKLEGVLGGYIPWKILFFMYGSSGWSTETMIGTDIPSAYYALRRHADAFPDPVTGENTAISAAFRIEAIPAFVSAAGSKQ